MANSDGNGYSAAFVDGVIRDYLAWKKKNTTDTDADNNQVITRIPAANPGAAPASNNQGAAGDEVMTAENPASSSEDATRQLPAYRDAIIGNTQNVMPVKEYINASGKEDSEGVFRNGRVLTPGTTAPAVNKAMSYDEMSGLNTENPVTVRNANSGTTANVTKMKPLPGTYLSKAQQPQYRYEKSSSMIPNEIPENDNSESDANQLSVGLTGTVGPYTMDYMRGKIDISKNNNLGFGGGAKVCFPSPYKDDLKKYYGKDVPKISNSLNAEICPWISVSTDNKQGCVDIGPSKNLFPVWTSKRIMSF